MKNSKKKYFYISSLENGIKVLELLADKKELTITKKSSEKNWKRRGNWDLRLIMRN
jgi:hypothetical protein